MTSPKTKRAVALKTQSFNIASVALRDAWTDFVLSRQAMQCTPATLQTYQKVLGRFIAFLEQQGITHPEQVNARHVRQYLSRFADRSDWYLNGIARAIRTLVRFWREEGHMPELVTFAMPKVRQKRLPFLDAEQVASLLAGCSVRERALIMLMVDSGLRRQEVCNLKRGDVDLRTGAVMVIQGKGRKDRLAFIGANARRALLAYLRTQAGQNVDAPLFQTQSGGKFTPAGLRSLFVRLSRRVGFKVTAHMLRRTFATLCLQNGMDVVSLQTLMGHENLETTRRYIQWLGADLLEAHRKASPIDNLRGKGKKLRFR
ncbi:MAG: tyrosine-type recombinase/integrase [Anaerolineales bacterium]|nr:tyrosine-type recombinase/integrase [Anaerolineales bacterium]